jgi:UDP-glucose 4-epimerase
LTTFVNDGFGNSQDARSQPSQSERTEERFREAFRGTSCLVTGSAGFIGFVLANRLSRYGADIVGVDIAAPRAGSLFPSHVLAAGNIPTSPLGNLTPDYVFHLGALNQELSQAHHTLAMELNVSQLGSFLHWCETRPWLRKLVYASSVSVYGASQGRITEDDLLSPTNLYGATKLAGEVLLHSGFHTIPAVSLRLSNVYGPGMKLDSACCGIVGKLVHAALTGDVVKLTQAEGTTRTYTFIDDTVDAILLAAMAHDAIDTAINIAGDAWSLGTLVNAVSAAMCKPILTMPGAERPIDTISYRNIDASLAGELLGWEPRFTITWGLTKFAHWLRFQEPA